MELILTSFPNFHLGTPLLENLWFETHTKQSFRPKRVPKWKFGNEEGRDLDCHAVVVEEVSWS
jgi:hypothetical protein